VPGIPDEMTMTKRFLARSFLSLLAIWAVCAPVQAQLFRAYLASGGSDSNPCTLAQPCRLLPAALIAVASGGEIWMLDSANYNGTSVTVNKSVTILAIPGAVGSVVATGGPAISITAGSLAVSLRNLVIVPSPSAGGTYGVSLTGASQLNIENCVFSNLATHAVFVNGAGKVRIVNTVMRNLVGWGVAVTEGAQVSVANSQILNSYGGVTATTAVAATKVTVSDSLIAGVTQGAVSFSSGAAAIVAVTRSTIDGAIQSALEAQITGGGSAVTSASGSVIANSGYAWYQAGGGGAVVKSKGNNHFENNNTSFGALTTDGLQ
jgi:hypothetical protein